MGTSVTIAGSNFSTAQGIGQVWLGTANAAVTNWSDTEIVATVADESLTGHAQELQNGVWSNSVTFTVTGGAAHIDAMLAESNRQEPALSSLRRRNQWMYARAHRRSRDAAGGSGGPCGWHT